MLDRTVRVLAYAFIALLLGALWSPVPASASAPSPVFSPHSTRLSGEAPTTMVAADFDHDGIDELLVSNHGSSSLSLFEVDVDGELAAPTTLSVPTSPRTPVAVDLNGDGDLDIAVALESNESIGVLLGNGDGTFGACESTIIGNFPVDLDAADIDRDGHVDLVTACASVGGIYVAYGNGMGGFSHTDGIPSGANARSAAIADFNADGWPDVAVASQVAGWVGIHINVAGELADRIGPATTFYLTGNHPYEITSGDMDRDGDIDLVVANANADGPGTPGTVLLNDGAAGFATTNAIGTSGDHATDAEVADFNGDGILDVALADYWASELRVHQGVGDGTFAESPDAELAISMPFSVIVADIDRDGLPDLASASTGGGDSAGVFRNNTAVSRGLGFAAPVTHAAGSTPRTVDSGDFDHDGNPDLVIANASNPGATVLFGNGSGGVRESQSFPAGSAPSNARFADMNRDGNLDIVIADYGTSRLYTLFGDGAGSVSSTTYVSCFAAVWVDVGDFNGDGSPDLAAPSYTGHYVQLFENDGAGVLSPGSTLLVFTGSDWPNTCALDDLNEDGDLDVVATSSSGGASVWLGDGTGAFGDASYVGAGNSPHGIEVADMDRDGHVDLVLPNQGSDTVTVCYGYGTGSFGASRTLTVGSTPIGATVGDINRDGLPDIVTGDSGQTTMSVYLNAGGRNFFQRPDIGLASSPYRGPCIVDFNRDGAPDLAQAIPSPEQAAVVLAAPTATPGTLRGTVTVDGNPQGGVTVQVVGMPLISTDSNGRYNVPLIEPGNYTVHFSRPNYTTVTLTDFAISANTVTTHDVQMELAPATFYGTVTAKGTGTALADVAIEVRGRDTDDVVASGSSASDGSFSMGGIAPDTYDVFFHKDGYVDHLGHGFTIYNGQSAYNPELELGGTLTGTVTSNIDGAAVGGVTVQISDLQVVFTNPLGMYAANDLPPGTYTVGFSGTEYDSQYVNGVTITSGATTTQDVVLVHKAETVVAAIDSPATGTTVVQGTSVTFTGHLASDTFGHSATDSEWRSNIDGLLAEDTARFSTSSLSVGTHTISVRVKCTGGTWSSWTSIQLTVVPPTADAVTAAIDTPATTKTVYVGDAVSFAGQLASDTKGHAATAYEWRSSIAGPLSSSASFSTSALSAGTHTVYFRVKCAGGLWSPDASVKVTVLKRPVTLSAPKVSGKASAKKGTKLVGAVKPARKTKVTLEVQRYSAKKYRAYKKYSATSASSGAYSYKAKLKKGTYRVRAVTATTSVWLPKTSAWRKVVVK